MTNEGEVLGTAMNAGLDGVYTALAKEPYSTPEEYDCLFCGIRHDRKGDETIIMDEAVCDHCELPPGYADILNTLFHRRMEELKALRKFRTNVLMYMSSAENTFQKDIRGISPAAANEPAKSGPERPSHEPSL